MSRMSKSVSLIVAAMLVVALSSVASAEGFKPNIPLVDPDGNQVGVAKIKAECDGEYASLEVEVELCGAMPFATCTASVMPELGELPDFMTDEEGEGGTTGDLRLANEPGDQVEVTLVVLCDGVKLTASAVVIVPDCSDD